jgi:fibronectin-binding autotransporter adhesin
LKVIGSSFAANYAVYGDGGAILNAGTATVIDSTFLQNYAGYSGGAIFNRAGATLTVTNSTMVKNGGNPGALLFGYPLGSGGISNRGTMMLNNTIVDRAGVGVGPDIDNTGVLTGSHNFIGDGGGGLANTLSGDPMLKPPVYSSLALLPNRAVGEVTFTLPPLPGSPCIDAGGNGSVASSVDQRGAPRIINSVVDIGSVEITNGPLTIVVTTLVDEDDSTIDAAQGTGTSLREALGLALPEVKTIAFAPGLTGTISLANSSLPLLSSRVGFKIVGPGDDLLTIDASALSGGGRILGLDSSSDVMISGLTFANGDAFGGGAIINSGKLTLTDCTFVGNTALTDGGAVRNSGRLTVIGCSFTDNSAGDGGAVFNSFEMSVTDSVFSGNSARSGGAIWTEARDQSSFTIVTPSVTNSTFSGNTATDYGGAIANFGGGGPAKLSVVGSTFYQNSSGQTGGAIASNGKLTVIGSTFYANAAANTGGAYPVVAGGIFIGPIAGNSDNYDQTVLQNNVVARGGAGLDVYRAPSPRTLTGSNNLIEDGSGALPDTLVGDPLLGPLADNGGPTQTMALLPNSPAINAGMAISGITTDQRGVTRPQGLGWDIGSYERQAAAAALTSTSYEYETRQAVTFSFNNDASVTFARSSFTLQNLTTNQTISPTAGTFSFNAVGTQASLVLTNLLPDGNYRVTIGKAILNFFVLAGDINRDRTVNFADLVILAQNYSLTGRAFSQGNLNYSADGAVDFDDLVILAQKYGSSLFSGNAIALPMAKKKLSRRSVDLRN